jgi:hypothetical protein
MKRFTYLLSITVAAFAIAAVGMIGCEGPAGATGQAGTNGADGIDANETCKVCHNDGSDLLVKQLQAGQSGHMTGGNQARSGADCAACHTHEGFIDRMTSGNMAASKDIEDATPPNCRTCHEVHESYTTADYALSYADPVKLWINDVTVDVKAGNTCANCHQPRVPEPLPVVGGDSVSITSPYWGPHHGTQSSILWGTAGYEITGAVSYPTTPGARKHADIGCTACHMSAMDEYGNFAGGHTFSMTYLSHGHEAENTGACTGCHSSLKSFDYNDVQTITADLIDSLKTIMIDKEILTASGGINTANKLSSDDAGALLNYKMVVEDKSMGVHNTAYSNALLKNSIEHLSK